MDTFEHLLESFFTPKPPGMKNDDLSEFCYQIVIRRDFQFQKTQCFQGFSGFLQLFPLNRGHGLVADVVEDAVYAFDLGKDAVADAF